VSRRAVAVAAVVAAAAAAAVVVALFRSGGHGSEVVARVGGQPITRRQLDLMVDHFHEEADTEGRPFPKNGSPQLTVVKRQALKLLVARAQDELAAGKLGVHVSATDVARRVAAGGGGETGSGETGSIRVAAEAAFVRSTAREQLVTERVYRKLTAGMRVSRAAALTYYRGHSALYAPKSFEDLRQAIESQLLAARKNARFRRWLAGARSVRVEIRDESLKG
jgi:hypothetical protein